MGMFDSVVHHCECGHEVTWQSKARMEDCSLERFDPSKVPAAIAADLRPFNREKCVNCGKIYRLGIQNAWVHMDVLEVKND